MNSSTRKPAPESGADSRRSAARTTDIQSTCPVCGLQHRSPIPAEQVVHICPTAGKVRILKRITHV